ncbi:MAG: EAL domain-containing protein [Sphingomonas sp.]
MSLRVPIQSVRPALPGRKAALNASSAAEFGDGGPNLDMRFLVLAEVTNFVAIRRQLGARRADALILDVAEILGRHLADMQIAVAGRTLLEIALDGDSLDALDSLLVCAREIFAQPVDLDGELYTIDIALGAAAGRSTMFDDVRLAEEAEEALVEAKLAGQSVVRDLSVATPAFDRKTLMVDFRRALQHEEFFIQYQPKVHLRRQQVASAEALIRWRHPERGVILPGDFIPAVEESREIGALTLWTLERVIADQKVLSGYGHDLTLFINISGQLLADQTFVARACQIVRDCDAKIGFEITETSVIRDPETAIGHLRVFADMGISIAIDDYGAGLSSLAYLKQLPASELKIDKLFVMQLTSSNRDPLIVRSTIDLAHALEMEVTAEGVETPAAMALLSVMGCDMVQGYLISRPIGIDALKQYLDEDRHLAASAEPRASFIRPASFWKSA